MTNTTQPMTFEDWYAEHDTLSEYSAKSAWQASQTQQAQTVAELVEALEVCKYDCNTGEVIGIAKQALDKVKGK